MQLRVDRTGRLRRHAGNALELFLARLEQPLRGAEMAQQRAPPRRAHALEVVEDRAPRPRLAPLAVEAEREPMSLVADPLQQLEPGGFARQHDRVRAARDEYLLGAL